jgi:hypothetical protein
MWAGRTGIRIPVEEEFSGPIRPAPRPTQTLVQRVPSVFFGVKAAAAWRGFDHPPLLVLRLKCYGTAFMRNTDTL